MGLRIENEATNVNWDNVVEILKKAGMSYHSSEIHKRAFMNSYSVVFVFDNETLIAIGRAISDGEYQAAIYDVAVLPTYQGHGIGRLIVQNLVKKTPNCNFMLYASQGKEKFYEKENFRKMKTGMALFVDGEKMQIKGFTE
jgi:ribosomal protein S18 acetylase RimI-like enzyme